MIKLLMAGAKIGVLAVVVMVISQIPVGQKRICDHVQDITQSRLIQAPIHWIADRFDFSDGKAPPALAAAKRRATRTTGSDQVSESDQDLISGLLKKPRD